MKRRTFITALGAAAAWSVVARGQATEKAYRVAFFSIGSENAFTLKSVLPDALRALGWIDGKNIVFESVYAENRVDRLPELAAELVRRNVDVIVVLGTPALLAVRRATSTVPIVFPSLSDPLGAGVVASLAHPGGNVTGLSLMAPDLSGKRLEILKELLPQLSRVAALWNAGNPYSTSVFKATQEAGQNLGIQIQSLEVRALDEVDRAFEAAARGRADALVTVEDALIIDTGKHIAELATKSRLPTMNGLKEFVLVGGLMSYGADTTDQFRRAAGYVDKILRGAKPGDLPVEQPTKFELVINLKTAKALGLEIQPALLARANEVIE
jgi:putative ABC transport system substrate-binding protein